MARPVERWLETFMCGQYAETFDAYGYKTLQLVCQLNPHQLQVMGVLPDHCEKIMENVSVLRQSYMAKRAGLVGGPSPRGGYLMPTDPVVNPASSALVSVARSASRGGMGGFNDGGGGGGFMNNQMGGMNYQQQNNPQMGGGMPQSMGPYQGQGYYGQGQGQGPGPMWPPHSQPNQQPPMGQYGNPNFMSQGGPMHHGGMPSHHGYGHPQYGPGPGPGPGGYSGQHGPPYGSNSNVGGMGGGGPSGNMYPGNMPPQHPAGQGNPQMHHHMRQQMQQQQTQQQQQQQQQQQAQQSPQQVADSILQMASNSYTGNSPGSQMGGPPQHPAMNKYPGQQMQGQMGPVPPQHSPHMMQNSQNQFSNQYPQGQMGHPNNQMNSGQMGPGQQFMYPNTTQLSAANQPSPMSPLQVRSPASVHSNHSLPSTSPGPMRSPAPNQERSPATHSVSSPGLVNMRSPGMQPMPSPMNCNQPMRSPMHGMHHPTPSPLPSMGSAGQPSPASVASSMRSPNNQGPQGHFSPNTSYINSNSSHSSPSYSTCSQPSSTQATVTNSSVYMEGGGQSGMTYSIAGHQHQQQQQIQQQQQHLVGDGKDSGFDPLQSLQKLVMLPESQVVDPKSVVNDACLPNTGESKNYEPAKNGEAPPEVCSEPSQGSQQHCIDGQHCGSETETTVLKPSVETDTDKPIPAEPSPANAEVDTHKGAVNMETSNDKPVQLQKPDHPQPPHKPLRPARTKASARAKLQEALAASAEVEAARKREKESASASSTAAGEPEPKKPRRGSSPVKSPSKGDLTKLMLDTKTKDHPKSKSDSSNSSQGVTTNEPVDSKLTNGPVVNINRLKDVRALEPSAKRVNASSKCQVADQKSSENGPVLNGVTAVTEQDVTMDKKLPVTEKKATKRKSPTKRFTSPRRQNKVESQKNSSNTDVKAVLDVATNTESKPVKTTDSESKNLKPECESVNNKKKVNTRSSVYEQKKLSEVSVSVHESNTKSDKLVINEKCKEISRKVTSSTNTLKPVKKVDSPDTGNSVVASFSETNDSKVIENLESEKSESSNQSQCGSKCKDNTAQFKDSKKADDEKKKELNSRKQQPELFGDGTPVNESTKTVDKNTIKNEIKAAKNLHEKTGIPHSGNTSESLEIRPERTEQEVNIEPREEQVKPGSKLSPKKDVTVKESTSKSDDSSKSERSSGAFVLDLEVKRNEISGSDPSKPVSEITSPKSKSSTAAQPKSSTGQKTKVPPTQKSQSTVSDSKDVSKGHASNKADVKDCVNPEKGHINKLQSPPKLQSPSKNKKCADIPAMGESHLNGPSLCNGPLVHGTMPKSESRLKEGATTLLSKEESKPMSKDSIESKELDSRNDSISDMKAETLKKDMSAKLSPLSSPDKENDTNNKLLNKGADSKTLNPSNQVLNPSVLEPNPVTESISLHPPCKNVSRRDDNSSELTLSRKDVKSSAGSAKLDSVDSRLINISNDSLFSDVKSVQSAGEKKSKLSLVESKTEPMDLSTTVTNSKLESKAKLDAALAQNALIRQEPLEKPANLAASLGLNRRIKPKGKGSKLEMIALSLKTGAKCSDLLSKPSLQQKANENAEKVQEPYKPKGCNDAQKGDNLKEDMSTSCKPKSEDVLVKSGLISSNDSKGVKQIQSVNGLPEKDSSNTVDDKTTNQSVLVEAIQCAATEPKQSASTEPIPSASIEANQSASIESIQSASIESNQSASVGLSQSASTEPHQSAPVGSCQSTSTETNQTASREPSQSISIDPKQYPSPEPNQCESAEPNKSVAPEVVLPKPEPTGIDLSEPNNPKKGEDIQKQEPVHGDGEKVDSLSQSDGGSSPGTDKGYNTDVNPKDYTNDTKPDIADLSIPKICSITSKPLTDLVKPECPKLLLEKGVCKSLDMVENPEIRKCDDSGVGLRKGMRRRRQSHLPNLVDIPIEINSAESEDEDYVLPVKKSKKIKKDIETVVMTAQIKKETPPPLERPPMRSTGRGRGHRGRGYRGVSRHARNIPIGRGRGVSPVKHTADDKSTNKLKQEEPANTSAPATPEATKFTPGNRSATYSSSSQVRSDGEGEEPGPSQVPSTSTAGPPSTPAADHPELGPSPSPKSLLNSAQKKRGRPCGSKNKVPIKRKRRKGGTSREGLIDYSREEQDLKAMLKRSSEGSTLYSKKKRVETARGPFVRVCGPKDSLDSCEVFNSTDWYEHEKTSKEKKSHKEKSSVPAQTNFVMSDSVPWLCAFCSHGSNYETLGDLFGPYYPENYIPNALAKEGEAAKASQPSTSTSVNETPESKRQRRRKLSTSPGADMGVASRSRRRSKSQESRLRSSSFGSPRRDSISEDPLPEIWVHEDCAVWSHGVYIAGGKVNGLEDAISHAKQQVCSHCRRTGANLGCYSKGCSLKYHYLCAVERDCLLDEENFTLMCPKHKERRVKMMAGSSSVS